MSSFYGPGGVGKGGSSGTSDYNELTNKPIKNILGTSEDLFFNLKSIDYGNYSLTGYFKTHAEGSLRKAESALQLAVSKDSSTGEKTITYMEVKDNTPTNHTIIYRDNGEVHEYTFPLNASGDPTWKDF